MISSMLVIAVPPFCMVIKKNGTDHVLKDLSAIFDQRKTKPLFMENYLDHFIHNRVLLRYRLMLQLTGARYRFKDQAFN
jgi:hypothetical protein